MRTSYSTNESKRPLGGLAAVFVDYENVYHGLQDRLDDTLHPDELIAEMLERLRSYLDEQQHARTASITAYADFNDLGDEGPAIQHALYLQGVDARFVPASLQSNAAEIQLCVDALDVLYNRPDVTMLVLVTGDRTYLPLLQQFRSYGRTACIVSVEPSPLANVPLSRGDLFLSVLDLVDEGARRLARRNGQAAPAPVADAPARAGGDVVHHPITDEPTRRTLEIIEEHFGQYDEVYLTPLLRKLSEVFDDDQYDPKSLVSTLEEAGAVWLEKRRGFPYDYTVLLVDDEHPDVQEAVEAVYRRTGEADDDETYAETHANGGRYDDAAWDD